MILIPPFDIQCRFLLETLRNYWNLSQPPIWDARSGSVLCPTFIPRAIFSGFSLSVEEPLYSDFTLQVHLGKREQHGNTSSVTPLATDASPFPSNSITVDLHYRCAVDLRNLALYLQGKHAEKPMEELRVVDTLFRSKPSMSLQTIGRSFFSSKDKLSLGGGAECWLGYHQSLQITLGRLLLNVDVSATAFHEPSSVIQFVKHVLQRTCEEDLSEKYLHENERIKLDKAIRGLKIAISHRGDMKKRYRVIGVTKSSAIATRFPLSPGEPEVSVADYFLQRYGIRLRYPNLPCLRCGAKGIFFPMEVCNVAEGQRHLRKLSETQTANMIKITCKDPAKRVQSIIRGVSPPNSYHR